MSDHEDASSRRPRRSDDEFFVRFYSGARSGRGGASESLEFSVDAATGRVLYTNESSYGNRTGRPEVLRRELFVGPVVLEQVRGMVRESKVVTMDDSLWPEPDETRQELEVIDGEHHISFACKRVASSVDVQAAEDPGTLQVFHELCVGLRELVLALTTAHKHHDPLQ